MDSNFDKIKKLFSEDNQQIPPELDWEKMEAGILNKMNELQSVPVQKNRINKFIPIAIGLTILLLLIPIICSNLEKENSIDTTSILTNQNIIADSKIKEKKLETQLENGQSSLPVDQSKTKKNNFDKINLKEKISETRNEIKSNDNQQESEKITNQKNVIKNINDGLKNSITGNVKLPTTKKSALTSSTRDIEKNILLKEQDKISHILEIEKISFKNVFVKSIADSIKFFNLPIGIENDTPTDLSRRLTLLGGVSFWNMGYGSSSKPDRSNFEQTILSAHTSLNYIQTFKKNFTFQVGLQFQQLESRLDINQSLDNYQITLTDTILEYQTNSLTGQQNEVRGDISLTVPAERIVRHYNKTRLLQIPFAIGMTWNSKKWQSDILMGGALNILSQNYGRTFYQGEIINYEGSSTEFLSNQWKLNAMLAGRLTYKINSNFGITTGLQFQKNLTNWSKEQNVKMNPNVFLMEIGINYFLK